MSILPPRLSKIEWWKEPRPQFLKDADEDPVLPLSEFTYRMRISTITANGCRTVLSFGGERSVEDHAVVACNISSQA